MADYRALILAFAAAKERLAAAAATATERQIAAFDGWYDPAAITDMVAAVLARVQPAQKQTVSLTDAYLARITSEMKGSRVQPVGPVDITRLRHGVAPAAAYGRLADNFRWLVSTGVAEADAHQQVVQRAVTTADTDTTLAFRAQAHRFMTTRGIVGYRRVLAPEIGKHGACDLCIAASDRVYHSADLLPIHHQCRCGVTPIIGAKDPGLSLNEVDLKTLYADAGGTGASSLHRVRYAIHHHKELGALLTQQGHHFRGPSDVAA